MATIDERLVAIESILNALHRQMTVQPIAEGREQLRQADVMTGDEFRRRLGWGKDRFFAAVKAGRFVPLISVNASSPSRPVYVRAKVDAWLSESPDGRRFFGKARGRR